MLGELAKSDILVGPELCGCIDPKVAEGGGVISNSPSTEGSRCVSIDPAKEITMGRIFPAIVGVVLIDGLLHSWLGPINEIVVVEGRALIRPCLSFDCTILLSLSLSNSTPAGTTVSCDVSVSLE